MARAKGIGVLPLETRGRKGCRAGATDGARAVLGAAFVGTVGAPSMVLSLGVVHWAAAALAVCQAPSPPAESRPAVRAPRPPIDLARIQLAFRALDADRGGSISWSEAKAAGLDPPRIGALDLDGDGIVTRDEFDWAFAHQAAHRGQALDTDVKARLAELAARGFPRTAKGESRPASRPGKAGAESRPVKPRSRQDSAAPTGRGKPLRR